MPLGTSDLVPYLSKIHRDTQACVVALFASDAVGFIQQREALGFNFKLMGMQGLAAGISPDVLKLAAGFYVPESLPRRLKDKDTPHNRLLRETEGMKLEESDDFPQGSTTIRAADHQTFVDLYLTQIQSDGFAKVIRKLAPKQYPAPIDYRVPLATVRGVRAAPCAFETSELISPQGTSLRFRRFCCERSSSG